MMITCSKCDKTFTPQKALPDSVITCPHCQQEVSLHAQQNPSGGLDPMAAYQPPTVSDEVKAPAHEQPAAEATQPTAVSQVTISTDGGRSHKLHSRRKSNAFPVIMGGIVVAALLVAGVWLTRAKTDSKPVAGPELKIADISKLSFGELSKVTFNLRTTDPRRWKGKVQYRAVAAPEGLSVSPDGLVSWQPSEEQGPGEHTLAVEVQPSDEATDVKAVQREFVFQVEERNRAPTLSLSMETATAGEPLQIQLKGEDPDVPASELQYRILNSPDAGANVDLKSGAFSWTPNEQSIGTTVRFQIEVTETGSKPLRAVRTLRVRVVSSKHLASATKTNGDKATKPSPKGLGLSPTAPSPSESMSKPSPKLRANAEVQTALVTRYKDKTLFRDYNALRALRAGEVWDRIKAELNTGIGPERFSQLEKWLDANPILREEILIALAPEDNAVRVFQIIDDIRLKYPEKAVAYGNLAMATALVWDYPRAVYDYSRHQRRSKATMPEGLLGGLANFEYILETENFMQGRGQWLPWEFLVHVVNHKTPKNERQWALQNYVSKRAMFGACYKHVPYDTEMLESKSQVAKMNGKVYHLPNLTKFGGVCAHQADYASRVGKSIGVPAAYVRGASNSGELHAWVMWVELKAVSQQSIRFSLESFGRYRFDKYYVGTLLDPKTGKRITDRALELQLQTVGLNAKAKRHAELLMWAFPLIKTAEDLDVNGRFRYISQVIKLCPGNESAWKELATMADEDNVRQKHRKQMQKILDQLFTTLGAFPDFTWQVFDDLIRFEPKEEDKIKLYQRLLLLYQHQKRPDLACEAALVLVKYLDRADRKVEAVEGLANMIQMFPDEGRYVPRLLDSMEKLCDGVDAAQPLMLAFYNKFIPLVPTKRGSRPSKYCISIHKRAIKRFQEAGQQQAVSHFQQRLAKIEAGQL